MNRRDSILSLFTCLVPGFLKASEPVFKVTKAVPSKRLLLFIKQSPPSDRQLQELDKLIGWRICTHVDSKIQLIDLDKEPSLRETYNVKEAPTFILMEKERETYRKEGFSSQADIQAMFNRSVCRRVVYACKQIVNRAYNYINRWTWPARDGSIENHLNRRHHISTSGWSVAQMLQWHDNYHDRHGP